MKRSLDGIGQRDVFACVSSGVFIGKIVVDNENRNDNDNKELICVLSYCDGVCDEGREDKTTGVSDGLIEVMKETQVVVVE